MKLLIFDFDGTIADSKAVYYKAMERVFQKLGMTKQQADEVIDIGLSISETLKKLGFSPIIRWYEKRKIMKEVLKHANQIRKCRDADHIKNIPGKKILVSNSLKEFILPVLKHLKIKDEFQEIYGAEDFDDKEGFIKEYIQKKRLNKKNVYYVGDRVADVRLAREAGVKVIIVSGKCAWNSREDLKNARPDYLVSEIDKIKEII